MQTIITWNGIDIEITYKPDYIRYDDLSVHYAHLEIQSVQRRHPLPMTETGYFSHFIPPQVVDDAGGAESYVEQWLNHANQSPAWKHNLDQFRQPMLL